MAKPEYCSTCLSWSTEGDPSTLFLCRCACHGPAGDMHTTWTGRVRGDGPLRRDKRSGKKQWSKW